MIAMKGKKNGGYAAKAAKISDGSIKGKKVKK